MNGNISSLVRSTNDKLYDGAEVEFTVGFDSNNLRNALNVTIK